MKKIGLGLACLGVICSFGLLSGCASSRNKKRGCVSTSAGMGAERVLAGEKPEKRSKFKIKNMN
jgi:hypothetical protein